MKKIIGSLILAMSIGGNLNADLLFQNDNFDDEFKKIESYVNGIFNKTKNNHVLYNLQNINYPKMNVEELKDKYILKFELAGMDKKDIKLLLDDNILVLEGEQKTKKINKSNDYLRQEIFDGKFKRSVQLPENINIDKMDSKFKNGILTITIPKDKIKKSNIKILEIK